MVTRRVVWWVLLAYRVPREPSAPRIAIWRKLRRLGVAQVGDGLVALPEDARTREQLEWVAADVDAAGGSAILWRAEMFSTHDERRLITQLQQARTDEYRALIVQAEQDSTGQNIEARAVDRLRRELRQVRRRDYFPPPEQEMARRAIDSLAGHAIQQAPSHAAGDRA